MGFTLSTRNAALAWTKNDDLQNDFDVCSHKTQHRSKSISFSVAVLQFFTLLQFSMSCNIPAAGHRKLSRYEFDVDNSCQPAASQHRTHDPSSAAMHLRGGTLWSEGYSRTGFSRASAVSFAPGTPTTKGAGAPFVPPLRPSMPEPVLWQYDSRAAARVAMPHCRRPKLSRTIEVDVCENE
eukprot:CAMPEP_0172181370 /NCGR_PEP_ID=MMETSP1050-20130122/17776_1 /TAXON_ID=233186 /ORGANISM="Cryptomonas curvata, Strain CCAP979/52" /LENGTH=180 /DNA_ID=CAMNT_0012854637 /DNA_START=148 /DNA_END=690 /DNA_ORIENTATION=+